MSLFRTILSPVALAGFTLISAVSSIASASTVADQLTVMASRVLPAETVAIYAEPLEGGEPIIDINGDKLMPPASCAKLVTAATALKHLGIDYRFHTDFLTDAKPNDASVKTLYIRGNGDPFLTPESLWRMARALSDHGVLRIRGDIVIDDSFFAGRNYPHKDSGNYHAYEAPTAAVSANFNVVEFLITPGNAMGSPAYVAMDPPSPYVKVINKVKTGPGFKVYAQRTVGEDHETFTLTGTAKLGGKIETMARSIAHPVRNAGSLFAALLKQNDIQLDGQVRQGKTPKSAYPFFEVPSRPLALLVRDMNKFSSNFIAEQIIQHLGGLRTAEPGTTKRGMIAIREWLDSVGIAPDEYVMENGSGLTDASRFTARQLVRILQKAGLDPSIGPDFMGSLSVLGVDGTMHHWHGAKSLRGILRAKTGTLRNVSNLAGYIPDADGKLIAFSIMSKGLKIGIYDAREATLELVEKLSKNHQNR